MLRGGDQQGVRLSLPLPWNDRLFSIISVLFLRLATCVLPSFSLPFTLSLPFLYNGALISLVLARIRSYSLLSSVLHSSSHGSPTCLSGGNELPLRHPPLASLSPPLSPLHQSGCLYLMILNAPRYLVNALALLPRSRLIFNTHHRG